MRIKYPTEPEKWAGFILVRNLRLKDMKLY